MAFKYRKKAKKGKPLLVAQMLQEYTADGNGLYYDKLPMWRIGYLCACRDAGLLTWNQWQSLVGEYREMYREGRTL